MMQNRRLVTFTLTLLASSFVAVGNAATVTTYTVPGSKSTLFADINRSSTITGTYTTFQFATHGFLLSATGSLTSFDVPGSTYTSPVAINLYGATTGTFYDANSVAHGFLRLSNGTYATFDVPGTLPGTTSPIGINPSNTIIGNYSNGGVGFAFVRNADGTFDLLYAPGNFNSIYATAVNDAGVVTGYYTDDPGNKHGFSWSAAGGYLLFDVPGGAQTTPSAINGSGTIAGNVFAEGQQEGFTLDANGVFTTFIVPGATSILFVSGINESGEIAGTGSGEGTGDYGFVRSPTGSIAKFSVPGKSTFVTSLNNKGIVVGIYGKEFTQQSFMRVP